MVKSNLYLIIALTLILSCASVIAAPPQFGSATEHGFDIRAVSIDFITINEPYSFHFHVFNSSDDIPVTNVTSIGNVVCAFHLYNNSGNHLYIDNNIKDINEGDVYDFEVKVPASNFSKFGMYAYIFQCNDTNNGGFVAASFDVTPDGSNKITSGESLMIMLGIFAVFLTGLMIFFVGFHLENPMMKFMTVILSLVLLIVVVFYTAAIIHQTVPERFNITDGYDTFFLIFKTMLSISITALIIFALWFVYRFSLFNRGMIDSVFGR